MRKGTRTVTIGGGTLRGRLLSYPEGAGLRPSMQRTKASMFSSLAGWIDGAVFADLFAGGGAVGIEALSRGACLVHFVERERAALAALHDNLERCAIESERYRVHAEPVARVLDGRPCAIADAAVVYADPPYDADVGRELLERFDAGAMRALSWLVVEHRTRAAVVPPGGMRVERRRRFGETTLSYLAPER